VFFRVISWIVFLLTAEMIHEITRNKEFNRGRSMIHEITRNKDTKHHEQPQAWLAAEGAKEMTRTLGYAVAT